MLKHFISRAFFIVSASLVCFSVFGADRLEQAAIVRPNPEQSLLLSIAQSQSRIVSVGEQGVIVVSDDDGKTWRQAQVPVSTLLTSVTFTPSGIAWSVGHDGTVLRSDDHGDSWQRLLTGHEINQLRKSALESELERIESDAEDRDDGKIDDLTYALDDAELAIEDGPTSPLLDVLFIDDQTGFVVGAYGLILTTADGGKSWRYIGHTLPNPDGLHLNRVYQLQSKRLLLLGEAGLLLYSDDLGNSWQEFNSPYDGSFFSAAETDALYILGLVGHSYRLDAESNNWESVDLATEATINDAIVVDGKLILAGQGGALLQQTEDGFTAIGERQLRSFTGLVKSGNTLILTGETGITRVDFGKE